MTYVINDLATALNTSKISARQLVENCLAAIDDPDGEGQRAFISTYHDRARQQADMVDHARKAGRCQNLLAFPYLSRICLMRLDASPQPGQSCFRTPHPPAKTHRLSRG